MTWVAAAVVGSSLISAYASNQASGAQAKGIKASSDAQERMFNKQMQLQEPWRIAGMNALPQLIYESQYKPFDYDAYQKDPGVGFRMKTGLDALERTASARGGLISGNQLAGAVKYGQEFGTQDYTNALNRYLTERAARLNPLQSLAGVGQTAANTMTNVAGQYGQNMAENAANMGNVRASSYMNTANALTGGINQGLNYFQNQQLMSNLFPKTNTISVAPATFG